MTTKLKLLYFLLLALISITCAWKISSPADTNKKCAQIFFRPSYEGLPFLLNSEEQFSNLENIKFYLRKQAEKSQQNGKTNEVEEGVSEGISFQVQEQCTLKLSSQPYLKGEQHEFAGDVDDLQESLFSPKSAACECPRNCQCEDNQLRNSECARAFLHEDCTNCKALFTSLKPGANWNTFPEKWRSDVKTIIVREGCDVSLEVGRSPSQIQTLSSSTETIFKEIKTYGNITRYQCTCSGHHHTSASQPAPRDANKKYPQLINIPKSKGQINTLLFREELKNHPGLMASLQSLRNKRSSKTASILLLGLTGSGKSSAVNLLFDHPNITKVGDYVSTTSDILQFSIPVPVEELGMNNTVLNVIDTPGIGDTRGVAEDARFLASLEDFLNKNEDLRKNLPNVVLIFSKFSDNRFRGEGSSFVKMLRTIDLFKDRIIDKKSTNVIFVLTHYMSETKDIQRDPSDRIKSIREVIQEFSSLPRPIHIVLAENKPDESQLPSINGFHRLPNGEFYPKNLFDQIQQNLVDNGDPVGEAIIRTAFSNSNNFKIYGKRYQLLHNSNAKVTKYLGILGSRFTSSVSATEVSVELNRASNSLDSSLKSRYPDILQALQRSLFARNIILESDLPQTTTDIFKLLQEIPVNPASLFLLSTAFNITVPEFKRAFVVGSGYSLINDETLPAQIFEAGNVTDEPSDILFRLPDKFAVARQSELDNQFQVFTQRNEFIKARMGALGLGEHAIPAESYSSSMSNQVGFNLISLSDSSSDLNTPQDSWHSLSASVNYHTFQIGLTAQSKFSDEFTSELQNLQQINLTNPENVRNWRAFFSRYGTHVVTHAFGGGSIRVAVEVEEIYADSLSNTEKFALLSEAMANITQQLANELIGKDSAYVPPVGVKYAFSQIGGDHKHYWSNFSDLDENGSIDEWKDSLRYEPVILKSRLQLLPISEIVNEIAGDRELAYKIEEAAANLLNASLVYIPTERYSNSDDNPESRDMLDTEDGAVDLPTGDFESMQEFSNMFQMITESNNQMQAQLLALMADSKAKQEKEDAKHEERIERLRQAREEQKRIEREEDRYNKELELRRFEIETQRQAQEAAAQAERDHQRAQIEMQQRVMMEEIRSKSEQTMLQLINMENERRNQIIMSRRSTLDKVFDYVQKGASSLAQAASSIIPMAMMG